MSPIANINKGSATESINEQFCLHIDKIIL